MQGDPADSPLPRADRTPADEIALVVIGRNEGERLLGCLRSVRGRADVIVYVDSGSTDGSVEAARAHGALVVPLDLSIPFTAARARNEGFRRAIAERPRLRYLQFVDGDCEVVPGWIETAHAFLDARPDVVAVCGRRRERYPQRSVYNLLCDLEWNSTAPGEVLACGGDAMMRADALKAVGGYRDDLIAGEEPELCVRLRARGGKVWRLDAEMTLHDAAMTRFGQWWKRSLRAGYAFAEGAHLHGGPPERHWVRESRSAWAWGAGLPALTLLTAALFGPRAFMLLLLYPMQVLRLFLRFEGPATVRWLRALFLVLGKFAEAAGQLKYLTHRWSHARARLIEYK
jgi:GT2 family glycosyltransferase